MLTISEIFKSIQGEGPWVGTFCTFVRLAHCNLNCSWCDTYQRNHKTLDLPPENLGRAIRGKNIVITGGEPMMHGQELFDFVEVLKKEGKKVAIETNGSFVPQEVADVKDHQLPDLMVVSPKLDDKFAPGFEEILEKWEKYPSKDMVYKFVVRNKRDVDYVIACVDTEVITKNVILQPCEPEKRAVPYIMKRADLLEELNIRVIPQTHKYLKVQ